MLLLTIMSHIEASDQDVTLTFESNNVSANIATVRRYVACVVHTAQVT